MRANALPVASPEWSLRLLPITIAAVRSELAGDGRLAEMLGAEVTSEWPPADWERQVLELLLTIFAEDPTKQEFHRYVLLERDGRRPVLIGCVGGFCWPDRPHEVEVGYSILPEFRRRGYATAAAREHTAWLVARPEGYEVVAQTRPELEASLRVLTALGFAPDGPGREEGAIGFRLRRSGA